MKELQEQADKFNKDFPVGTAVMLMMDMGEVPTRVRGKAFVTNNRVVAFFQNIAGYYCVADRVRLDLHDAQTCSKKSKELRPSRESNDRIVQYGLH